MGKLTSNLGPTISRYQGHRWGIHARIDGVLRPRGRSSKQALGEGGGGLSFSNTFTPHFQVEIYHQTGRMWKAYKWRQEVSGGSLSSRSGEYPAQLGDSSVDGDIRPGGHDYALLPCCKY